ncbi:hypothetical protein MTR_1g102080 [Medicago truncatula]|uniref:Uncharacterized protein n=1 Tax=Medicago truncatula TaxID=3880 RepID=G7IC46_MEDTR|nr:hypothetical protein MTR_1g102080 [Medicago truncatula]
MIRKMINFICLQETMWVDQKSVGDQTIDLKFMVEQDTLNIISTYTPQVRGFEGLHMGYGLDDVKPKGNSILGFLTTLDLTISNACFKKIEKHLII